MRGMLADQNAYTACQNDLWSVYENKDFYGRGDIGRIRVSDFSDLDAIKAHVLNQGANVIIFYQEWGYMKRFNYTPSVQEMDGCDGCIALVYSP